MPAYRGQAKDNPWASGGLGGVTAGTLTAEAGNARTQSYQFTDEQGRSLTGPRLVHVWLSANSDGTDIVGVAATSLVAGTNGKKLADIVVGKIAIFQTDSSGRLDVTINDAAARTDYLCVGLMNGLNVQPVVFV